MKKFYLLIGLFLCLSITSIETYGAKYGFLSLKNTPADISNPDELEAFNWFSGRFGADAEFVSFNGIENKDLSSYTVLWWHNDDVLTLPSLVTSNPVLAKMQSFVSSGRSLLLSTYAVQYITALNISKDGFGPNINDGGVIHQETYGEGFSINGHEGHPIFTDLVSNGRVWDFGDGIKRLYTLNDNTWRSSKQSVWGFGSSPYLDVNSWKTATGAIDLGGAEWEGNRGTFVTMAEFPKNNVGTNGSVICIGSRAYDWSVDHVGQPDYVANSDFMIDNIKILTYNTITYLNGNVTVLPITLSDFTANTQNNSVLIKWTTKQEINNLNFALERSNDGKTFKLITQLKGAINSSSEKKYAYYDVSAAQGINYYRLKQIDSDGKYSYSTIISVTIKHNIEQVNLVTYPNPIKQTIKINGLKEDGNSYAIFNLTGRKLLAGTVTNNEINISNKLNTGTYILAITQSDKSKLVSKILVD